MGTTAWVTCLTDKNWYGDNQPGWGSGNLTFHYDNGNSTSIYDDYGFNVATNDIFFASTFPRAITWDGNSTYAINFNQRLENDSAFTVTIGSVKLSGAKNGANHIELNPVGGDMILNISTGLFNDNSVPYQVYGGGGHNLTINAALGVGRTAANVSFTDETNNNVKFTAAQTFAGGLYIYAGTVTGTGSTTSFGLGSITLGNTSSTTATAGLFGDNHTFTNAISVASGSSGTLTVGNTGNVSAVFSGAVTLANNLTLTASGGSSGSVKLSGGVTGTGNLILNNTNTGGNSTFLDTTLVNNAGTITNSGTGTGSSTINAKLGGNVTQLNENSSTSNLVLSMSGNTAFVGSVNVTAGTLQINGTASALNSANVVSVASAGVFDINGQNQTIAGLATGTGIVTNSGAAKTLTLGGSGTYSFSGTITGGANMAITKSTGGTQTLAGTSANTYTGLTTVSGGELDLSKTAGVNAIAGDGNTATNDVTVSGGTLKWLANEQVGDTATITLSSGTVNLNGQTETLGSFTNSGGTFTTGVGES